MLGSSPLRTTSAWPERHPRRLIWWILGVTLLAVAAAGWAAGNRPALPAAPTAPPPSDTVRQDPDFGRLPLAFTANHGQSDPVVRYQAKGLGGTLFFTPAEIVLSLPGEVVAAVHFAGANPNPSITGTDSQPGTVNYLLGKDPAQWRTDIPTYGAVVYGNLYPGIDLRYDGRDGRLKGTYQVAPGADPALIRWRYQGATALSVDPATGDLQVALTNRQTGEPAAAPLIEKAPIAWQDIGATRVPVPVSYQVTDGDLVSLNLGAFDPAHPLVIDPELIYATFLGGSDNDEGNGIAVDAAGNVYVTGMTSSTDFPIAGSPVQNRRAETAPTMGGSNSDAFITKLNAQGSALVYSTYLGGEFNDYGAAIAVDSAGQAHVTGWSQSGEFPTVNDLFPTARSCSSELCTFVAKLNADGSALVYSSQFRTGVHNQEKAGGIAVDRTGNAYVTGQAWSQTFPTTPGALLPSQPDCDPYSSCARNAFVTKLDPSGALVYSTLLGSSRRDPADPHSPEESGRAIAVDGDGNAYIAGRTNSSTFPVSSNAFQRTKAISDGSHGFAVKLSPDGSRLVYSTYLGGNDEDAPYAIALDPGGNVYLTGETQSADFPLANAFRSNCLRNSSDVRCSETAFVTKLNADASALVYSSYLGLGRGWGIAVDSSGGAYVTGSALDAGGESDPLLIPTVDGFQTAPGDSSATSAFVAKLNTSGSAYVYSTRYSGTSDTLGYPHHPGLERNNGQSEEGRSIALDSAGNAYITGWTTSRDLLTVGAPPQAVAGSAQIFSDAFIAKIGNGTPLPTVSFSSDRFGVVESAGPAALTLTLSAPSPYTVTVAYAVGYGHSRDSTTSAFYGDVLRAETLLAGSDYPTSTVLGTATIPPGRTTGLIHVPLINDQIEEPTETISVTLQQRSNARVGSLREARLAVVDDPCEAAAWQIFPTPASASGNAALRDLTVLPDGTAWAVGGETDKNTPLIMRHASGAWQILTTPGISGTLSAVAARSADDIWAVGSSNQASNEPLIMRWNGTSWTQFAAPVQGHMQYAVLNAVLPLAANDVWAVGSYSDLMEDYRTVENLVMHFDGTSWQLIPSRNAADAFNVLQALTTTPTGDLVAIGHASTRGPTLDNPNRESTSFGVIGRLNADRSQLDVSAATGSDLRPVLYDGVALDADTLVAVGSAEITYYPAGMGYQSSQYRKPYAVRIDGAQSAEIPTPDLGTGGSQIYSLSSVGPNDMWASGSYASRQLNEGDAGLILHWDGLNWSQVSSPNARGGYKDPAGGADPSLFSDFNRLEAIAVRSATDGWAVGQASFLASPTDEGHIVQPLILRLQPNDGCAGATIPTTGGQLSAPAGVMMELPAGSFSEPAVVSANHLITGSTQLAPELHWAGGAFGLAAIGTSGQPITRTATPYTLRIAYTDDQLARANVSESELNLAYFDGTRWVTLLPCAGCGVDAGANQVTVQTDQIAEFVLVGGAGSGGSGRAVFLPLVTRHHSSGW